MSRTFFVHARRALVVTAALAGSLSAFTAQAALVSLNTGTNILITYDDVANATALTLFGTPTLSSADVLSFTPTNFTATSLNASGAVITSATFALTISGKGGFQLSNARVNLRESGDYRRVEVAGGEGKTSVGPGGQLRFYGAGNLLGRNDIILNPPLGVVQPIAAGPYTSWLFNTGRNLNSLNAAVSGNTIDLQIENNLSASSLFAGDSAFIQKKAVSVTVSAVPIPAAAFLFAPALGLLIATGRRRRAV